MKNYKKFSRGYIALITVIIVGAIVLAMVISSTVIGIYQSHNGLLAENLAQADSLAAACAEKTLMELKNNENYLGNETMNLGNGQCQIAPIENLGAGARVVKTSGTVNQATKKIRIEISQINPAIVFISWQEVADF